MYGTIQNTHREKVSATSDQKTLAVLTMSGQTGCVTQTTITRTETWTGLSKSDAESLLVSSESSQLSGTTRNYLGGLRITVGNPQGEMAWQILEACWGTQVKSQYQRMGDTNLYQVTRQTTNMSVTSYGCSSTQFL